MQPTVAITTLAVLLGIVLQIVWLILAFRAVSALDDLAASNKKQCDALEQLLGIFLKAERVDSAPKRTSEILDKLLQK